MPDLDRIAALEKRVSLLEQKLKDLADAVAARDEKPQDKRAITEKTRFDWQS